jgi:hypothetical protein
VTKESNKLRGALMSNLYHVQSRACFTLPDIDNKAHKCAADENAKTDKAIMENIDLLLAYTRELLSRLEKTLQRYRLINRQKYFERIIANRRRADEIANDKLENIDSAKDLFNDTIALSDQIEAAIPDFVSETRKWFLGIFVVAVVGVISAGAAVKLITSDNALGAALLVLAGLYVILVNVLGLPDDWYDSRKEEHRAPRL